MSSSLSSSSSSSMLPPSIQPPKRQRMRASDPRYAEHRREQLALAARKSRAERKTLEKDNVTLLEEVKRLKHMYRELELECQETPTIEQDQIEEEHDELVEQAMSMATFVSKAFAMAMEVANCTALSAPWPCIDQTTRWAWRIDEALDDVKFTCLRLMDASKRAGSVRMPLTTDFHSMMVKGPRGRHMRLASALDGPKRTPVFRLDWDMRGMECGDDVTAVMDRLLPTGNGLSKADTLLTNWGVQSQLVPELSRSRVNGIDELRTLQQHDDEGTKWMKVFKVMEETQAVSTLRPEYVENEEDSTRSGGVLKCITALVAMIRISDNELDGEHEVNKQLWSVWREDDGVIHVSMVSSLAPGFHVGPVKSRDEVITPNGQLSPRFMEKMRWEIV